LGVDIPQSILTYALIIVMSGILISSRSAFFMSSLVALTIMTIGYLQQEKFIIVSSSWRKDVESLTDSLVIIATFYVIFIVSWLSNRETEKALKRARASEKALKQQRDLLEVKVEERT